MTITRGAIAVGDKVTYRDEGLRKEYKVFMILPCTCPMCQVGDTFLVDLPSLLNSEMKRHVGHEMIERARPLPSPSTGSRSSQ